MNPILVRLYKTEETIKTASAQVTQPVAQPVAEPTAQEGQTIKLAAAEEAALEESILDQLVKVAAAQGVDLMSWPDADIVALVQEEKAGLLKEASAGEAATAGTETIPGVSEAALNEADILGQVMAHSFTREKGLIDAARAEHEKLASLSDDELLDHLATERANAILSAVVYGEPEAFEKEASMEIAPEMAELDDLVTLRAQELLYADGWDTDALADGMAQ